MDGEHDVSSAESDNDVDKVAASPASSVSSRSSREASQSPANSLQSRGESGPQSPQTMSSAPHSPDSPRPSTRSGPGSPPSPRSRSPSNESAAGSNLQQNSQNGASPRSPQTMDDASNVSLRSMSSRGSKRAHVTANLEDGNSSDSSLMSDEEAAATKPTDNCQAEEISDGDIESDNEKVSKHIKETIPLDADDLSDVSDLDESIGGMSDNESKDFGRSQSPKSALLPESHPASDRTNASKKSAEKRAEEGEEQLDFEAEDGECGEEKEDASKTDAKEAGEVGADRKPAPKAEGEELEEGEVTDEDDVRPEEVEPRPVCRFFSRGQCTWGSSCRFLHPGVTDKGNYTMFEMIRPVVPGEYGREERMPYGRAEPPQIESAWERGLRTAKEMLRKSIKRKEQDIDFEDKKKNLSLTQDELEKENGYYMRMPSPEPRYVRHPVPMDYPPSRPPPEEYYNRRQVLYEPEYPPPPRERPMRPMYREPPMHRPPPAPVDYRYEEEPAKLRRAKREVIVQRVVEERPVRADEWTDPWMRSKSPGAKKRPGKRSYSSGSSYSSSSSSRSSSRSSRSSYRSRSRSPPPAKAARARPPGASRGRHVVSPSVIVSERKAASERAALMNPPAPKKKAPSPGMMRAGAQNPPAPARLEGKARKAMAAALARVKGRRKSSRSSSASSSASSSSDSDSSSSSSSSREPSPPARRSTDVAMAMKTKAVDVQIKPTVSEKRPIKMTFKNSVTNRKELLKQQPEAGKKRPASPPSAEKIKKAAGVTSRREELLKQLKAVEDAIAKKRSKVN